MPRSGLRPRSSGDRALASGARCRRFESCRGYSPFERARRASGLPHPGLLLAGRSQRRDASLPRAVIRGAGAATGLLVVIDAGGALRAVGVALLRLWGVLTHADILLHRCGAHGEGRIGRKAGDSHERSFVAFCGKPVQGAIARHGLGRYVEHVVRLMRGSGGK